MNREPGTNSGGATRIEAVVLLVVGWLVVGLAAAAIPRCSDRVRRQPSCADNMRQLALGLFEYLKGSAGAVPGPTTVMPAGNQNVFALVAPYTRRAARGRGSRFLCPQDRLNDLGKNGVSYALNCTTFDTVARVHANGAHSPFGTRPAEEVRLDGIAPDTILAIEYWGRDVFHQREYSILGLDRPDKPTKHALRAPPDIDDPYALVESPSHALSVDGAGRVQRPAGVVHEWAANQAGFQGFSRTFHDGRVNVLFADGHVGPLAVERLATGATGTQTLWTREED